MTLEEAERVRQRVREHFPSTCPSVAELLAALEQAEQCRTITLSVTFSDAIALRAAVRRSAPGFVTDSLRLLMAQLPTTWPEKRSADVLFTIGDAAQLYRHHSVMPHRRRRLSHTIMRVLDAADTTNSTITPAMPWVAAHIIDTVAALHPNDRLLRRLRSTERSTPQ